MEKGLKKVFFGEFFIRTFEVFRRSSRSEAEDPGPRRLGIRGERRRLQEAKRFHAAESPEALVGSARPPAQSCIQIEK